MNTPRHIGITYDHNSKTKLTSTLHTENSNTKIQNTCIKCGSSIIQKEK